MRNVLIYADSIRSPELRHEVPLAAPDPFIYVELNGSRHVYASSIELPRLVEFAELEVFSYVELGVDELVAQKLGQHERERELVLRACRHAGVEDVVTPASFPLDVADHLRANGIELHPDGKLFDLRRRAKSDVELEGVRRAQRGCELALDAIRARLRHGGGVSCEELRAEALRAFTEEGLVAPDIVIVSHGPQTAVGHEPGHGPIEPGEPVVVDLFPRDPETGCFADMTRTFCIGEPPEQLVEQHALCLESLERVYGAVRAGVFGSELHRISCGPFEAAGYPTELTKEEGQVLDEGYFHSLGHGVGLELHEQPSLGRVGEELVEGDVIAIEPGVYRKGFGGCRLEDLVRVTAEGCERLTDYPYDLAP
jgi:Xaa-Pro aminopeptidase